MFAEDLFVVKHLLFFVKNETNTIVRTEPKIKKVVLLVILLDATVEVVECADAPARWLGQPRGRDGRH